jgi:hypothetical protein
MKMGHVAQAFAQVGCFQQELKRAWATVAQTAFWL